MSNKAETYYTYDVIDGLQRLRKQDADELERDGRDWVYVGTKGLCGDMDYLLLSLSREEEYDYRHQMYVSLINRLDMSGDDDPISESVIYFTDALSLATYINANLSNVVWG